MVITFVLSGCLTQSQESRAIEPWRLVTATVSTDLAPTKREEAKLPWRWDRDVNVAAKEATLRIDLTAVVEHAKRVNASGPWALYASRIGNQAQISIVQPTRDGEIRTVIANFGTLGDPSQDHAKRPIWIDVFAQALTSPGATLEIKLTGQKLRYAGLSSIYVGPASMLIAQYNKHHFWRLQLGQIAIIAFGILGIFSFGFWLREHDALYGIFAACAALGMFRVGDWLWVSAPLPWPLWGGVCAAAYAAHLLTLARFTLQACEAWRPWMVGGFWAWLALTTAGAAASFSSGTATIWSASLVTLALPGALGMVAVVRAAYRSRRRDFTILALAAIFITSMGVRDFVTVRLAVRPIGASELSFSLMPLAMLAYVLAMAWFVVERHGQRSERIDELNDELTLKLAQREHELMASFETIKEKDQLAAAAAERTRIMRDLHDSVGSQLTGIASRIRREIPDHGALLADVNAAMDELKLSVDAMQPMEGDVGTVLAALRYRLEPRWRAAGLEVVWKIEDLPPLQSLTPEKVKHLQRIVFEAMANVVKHAHASQVTVTATLNEQTRLTSPSMCIVIEDNGRGFDAADMTVGQGIPNMHFRARQLGADLLVRSAPGQGTSLRLDWPVQMVTA